MLMILVIAIYKYCLGLQNKVHEETLSPKKSQKEKFQSVEQLTRDYFTIHT